MNSWLFVVKKTLHESDETGVDSNIVVVQHGIVWTKSLQLNDRYSDSVNLS